jgi:hypothetical protein
MIKSLATPVNASCWTRYSRHVRFGQPHHKMGLDVPATLLAADEVIE